MPLNYQDPYSAFGNGLQGGMGFATGLLQLKQQKELMAQKKAQEGYDNDYKKFKTTLDFLESKGGKKLPNKTKVDLYNGAVVPFMTKYASEVPFKPLTEWGDTQDDFTTKLNAIDASSNDRTFKMKALNDLQAEAEDARQEAAVKGKIDALKTEDYKQGMMLDRQARATPELQSNPEIYNDVMNERDNLLAGNTQGQEYLRQQANEATRVENKPEPKNWQVFYDKRNKPVTIDMKDDSSVARIEKEGLTPATIVAGEKRAAAFAQNRLYQVLDANQGNRPRWVQGSEINNNPNRYIASGEGVKALNKSTLLEDMRGTIQGARKTLNNPNLTFDTDTQAKVARLLTDRDPASAISAFLDSKVGMTLTNEQQDYLVSVQQLIENAMAMRSVLGAGQGSEDLRNAIRKTIPGASTPSREYALKQLTAFEQTINRLGRGIPSVDLKPMPGATSGIPEQSIEEKPPVPGAKKAPDGKWYIQKNGKFFRVD